MGLVSIICHNIYFFGGTKCGLIVFYTGGNVAISSVYINYLSVPVSINTLECPLMETGKSPAVAEKKNSLTPKAIIKQKYGSNACYMTEEVLETAQNGCPGLAIPQKGPCLFRCTLEVPEFKVTSEICRKKKDAEQSASKMALEKLGVNHEENDVVSIEDPWDNMVARLSFFFSNEFLATSNLHPLKGHLRAVLRRDGSLNGLVPLSVMGICDSKLSSLCKSINPMVELNPLLAVSLIAEAAARLPESIVISKEMLCLRRQSSYSSEVIQSLDKEQSILSEGISIKAVFIPYALEKIVEPLSINVASNEYYLDAIAQKLHVEEASNVLVSRSIGKASLETRLYFCAPVSCALNLTANILHAKESVYSEESFNPRASYFSGQDIYGNAILASVGYTRKFENLFYEDFSLQMYYRMLISKTPCGLYKLSREATLAAELPLAFTTRTNWRGSSPRDLLSAFCHQHYLAEPVFCPVSYNLEPLCKGLKIGQPENCNVTCVSGESQSVFRCEIKILSKSLELIIECFPEESHKKQNDAIMNASLKVLSWLNMFFKELDMPFKNLISSGDALCIKLNTHLFSKAFSLCQSVHNVRHKIVAQDGRSLELGCLNQSLQMKGDQLYSLNIDGSHCGATLPNNSIACISYAVSLITGSKDTKELLESCESFEFEIGTGAVISLLEAAIAQMSIGQSAHIVTELIAGELILAAGGDSAKIMLLLSSKPCRLEYSINLMKVTEPLEDRMEQAFFHPPLSKQRVEYALQHIKESSATTLVDFGCGSGSLFGSLLEYPTTLEKIAGVDISQKSLTRAAKVLHSKLSVSSKAGLPSARIKTALLYDGSITDVDSRLYGFDIATCLEVIEHMPEDQASLFGDVVLNYFCPKILVVSTPNYEYNVILQRSNLNSQEEDLDETNKSQLPKFRNHDHKFEWTREQFNSWAMNLAQRHNYSVEFGGVGGSSDVEPGYATQIAVFRSSHQSLGDDSLKNIDVSHRYEVVWEWRASDVSNDK